MYLDAVQRTETECEAGAVIEGFTKGRKRRPWEDIPV
jgi:hypothetical protein